MLAVIPCLNEADHLPGLLELLCADAAVSRIVVVDGGSTDASTAIVSAKAEADRRIVLMHNAARIQSAGVNLAVRRYAGEHPLYVRIDAHAAYPPGFVSRLIEAQRQSGADSIAVSMRAAAAPGACFQEAAACAQNSVLGAGGSAHRKPGPRVWVDHGHHALFRTEAFLLAGGYDESFTHNEDAELDVRLRARGGRILLAGDIVIDYFPRATPAALARQYFNYGRGRARTARKHKLPLKLRQWAPAAVAPAIAAGLLLAPLSPWALAAPLAWLAGCLSYGALIGLRSGRACAAAAGAAAAIMHFTWSVGFLSGLAGAGASPSPRPATDQPAAR